MATFLGRFIDPTGTITINWGNGDVIDYVVETDINNDGTSIEYIYSSTFSGIIHILTPTVTKLFIFPVENSITNYNLEFLTDLIEVSLNLDLIDTAIAFNSQTMLKHVDLNYNDIPNLNYVFCVMQATNFLETVYVWNNNSLILPVVNGIDIYYKVQEPQRNTLLIDLDANNTSVFNGVIHADSFNFADPLVQQAHDNLVSRGWTFDLLT